MLATAVRGALLLPEAAPPRIRSKVKLKGRKSTLAAKTRRHSGHEKPKFLTQPVQKLWPHGKTLARLSGVEMEKPWKQTSQDISIVPFFKRQSSNSSAMCWR